MKTNTSPINNGAFLLFVSWMTFMVLTFALLIFDTPVASEKPELPPFNVEPTTTITAKP